MLGFRHLALPVLFAATALLPGCMTAYRKSVGATTEQNYSKVFVTDGDTVWQSVLEALKSFRLDVSNREAGFLQTRWTDNTTDRNFVDSFGGADSYLKAQFRFKINVNPGFFAGTASVKLTVQREQWVQRDVLEGWRAIETDGIEEATLLYRIERIITMRVRLAEIERERTEKQIEQSGSFD
jgi:NlpB/DapX lipoprotein